MDDLLANFNAGRAPPETASYVFRFGHELGTEGKVSQNADDVRSGESTSKRGDGEQTSDGDGELVKVGEPTSAPNQRAIATPRGTTSGETSLHTLVDLETGVNNDHSRHYSEYPISKNMKWAPSDDRSAGQVLVEGNVDEGARSPSHSVKDDVKAAPQDYVYRFGQSPRPSKQAEARSGTPLVMSQASQGMPSPSGNEKDRKEIEQTIRNEPNGHHTPTSFDASEDQFEIGKSELEGSPSEEFNHSDAPRSPVNAFANTDAKGRFHSARDKHSSKDIGSQDLHENLKVWHTQDVRRDHLFMHLHQENLDLLEENEKLQGLLRVERERPRSQGVDHRAEAAERNLWEAHTAMKRHPFVYSLIDGNGYLFHDDLLVSGKRGGVEAADRLLTEIKSHIHSFEDSKNWSIMVDYYADVKGLLVKCAKLGIAIEEEVVREFAYGFTQAQPLFDFLDIGRGKDTPHRKIHGLFHIFANNVHCKHIIFGGCHDSSYAPDLQPYISNPIDASRISLLSSYEDDWYFSGLPFEVVTFSLVFVSKSSHSASQVGANDNGYHSRGISNDSKDPKQHDATTDHAPPTISNNSTDKAITADTAIAKWQISAGRRASEPSRSNVRNSTPISRHQLVNRHSTWGPNDKVVILNVNDERVDAYMGPIDLDVAESMLDRIEERKFCQYYHLNGKCGNKFCRYRHEPRLSKEELVYLRYHVRQLPCDSGSRCGNAYCIFGHVCPNQPGCEKGRSCPFYRVHEVDQTAVRVWHP